MSFIMELWQRDLKNVQLLWRLFLWIVKEHGDYTILVGAVRVKFEVQCGVRY